MADGPATAGSGSFPFPWFAAPLSSRSGKPVMLEPLSLRRPLSSTGAGVVEHDRVALNRFDIRRLV